MEAAQVCAGPVDGTKDEPDPAEEAPVKLEAEGRKGLD
jgi:hypothetical protein